MFRKSLNVLLKTWRTILPHNGGEENASGQIDDRLAKKIRLLMSECLSGKGGEVSASQRAARLGSIYLTLAPDQRTRFLNILAETLRYDRQSAVTAAEAFLSAPDDPDSIQSLRRSVQSPHRLLLKQFNSLPDGIHFLVNMRADLLDCMGDNPALRALNEELRDLLADWFDIGFLKLARIDWDSPASLLEKLVAYEAVHEIDSWQDLHNRLESDRRCYAFFHPGMPDEPLIFIEIALVNGISRSVQELLDTDAPQIDPHSADTAIFYSISNTQKGLQGISFGNFLIKRVVEDLRRELPNLKTYSTLSPIPGFTRWLKVKLEQDEPSDMVSALRKAVRDTASETGETLTLDEIMAVPDWHVSPVFTSVLQEPLLRLCALYLHDRRHDNTPIDPVERFHLGNGASLEQIHWKGDTSPNGVRQSYGLMVNYLYKLDEIEKNHEEYADNQKIVSSARVSRLCKG